MPPQDGVLGPVPAGRVKPSARSVSARAGASAAAAAISAKARPDRAGAGCPARDWGDWSRRRRDGSGGRREQVDRPGPALPPILGGPGPAVLKPDPEGFLQVEQRAHRVQGRGFRLGLAEGVAEHLQREGSAVPGGQHVPDEAGQVETTLTREATMVPGPLQHVHGQHRCVGQLQEEDLLARHAADSRGIRAAGEDVKAVEAHAERRMAGRPDDLPRVLVLADMPAPGQRLVGDHQAARRGPLGQSVEVLGGQGVVADRVRGHVGADQHGVRAQALHDVELALRPLEVGREAVGRHRLEVAEGLVELDRQAQVRRLPADPLGRERRVDQVALEDLHALESGLRDRGQLLRQRATD